MSKKILILNGPNLNLVGIREPEIYGHQTMEEYILQLKEKYPQHNLIYVQSNHEGVLIDKLHEFGFDSDGIILNGGAYTHTSIALADAIKAITSPVIEVHISNIQEREEFRKHSYLTSVCKDHVIGEGMPGYEKALKILIED